MIFALLDQTILSLLGKVENGAIARKLKPIIRTATTSGQFISIADDLEWLRNKWWQQQAGDLSDGDIRRGSALLHLLLVQGLIGTAWRHYGFSKEPRFEGPDIIKLAERAGLRPAMAASLVAGGGRIEGIDLAFVGAFRIDNPSTGIPADADEGFAVSTTCIARDASAPTRGELDLLVHRTWWLAEYLESAGAIRRGEIIKRREIIDYFRNYAGGAHHDLTATVHRKRRTNRHELIHELSNRVLAATREGLCFELLSIGQAVGRAEDTDALIERIRQSGGV